MPPHRLGVCARLLGSGHRGEGLSVQVVARELPRAGGRAGAGGHVGRHAHLLHLHRLLLDVGPRGGGAGAGVQVAVLLVTQVRAGGHRGQGLVNRGQLARVLLVQFHCDLLQNNPQ